MKLRVKEKQENKLNTKKIKIGVLGGSFDPAHKGHLAISKEAKKRFQLQNIIWAITKKNPFKVESETTVLKRIKECRRIIGSNSFIKVKFYENLIKSNKTIDLINHLKKNKNIDIYFLMGADNLSQFPQWKRATDIAKTTSILVMNRPDYGWQALASQGASLLGRQHRRKEARQLGRSYLKNKGRGWAFHLHSRNALSATLLRSTRAV